MEKMTSGNNKQAWDPSQSDPTKLSQQQLEVAKSQGYAVFAWPKDLDVTDHLFERMGDKERKRAKEIVSKVKKGLLLPRVEYHFVHCFVQYWQQKKKEKAAQMVAGSSQDGSQKMKYNWPAGCKVTDEDLAELNDIERNCVTSAQKGEPITLAGCKAVNKWLGQRMLQRSLIERPDPPLKMEDLEQTHEVPTKKSELEELKVENRELSRKVEQLSRQISVIQQSKARNAESEDHEEDESKTSRVVAKIELGDIYFSGDVNEDPDWWAKQIKTLMIDYKKYPREEQLSAVGRQLKGNAWRWFVGQRAEDPDMFYTWRELVAAVKRKFTSKHLDAAVWNELVTLKQDKLSIYDYIAKFEQLANRVRPRFDDSQLVIMFRSGLRDIQAAREIDRLDMNLSEAYDLARSYAPYEVPIRTNVSSNASPASQPRKTTSQNQRKCFHCKQAGHLIAKCPILKSQQSAHNKGTARQSRQMYHMEAVDPEYEEFLAWKEQKAAEAAAKASNQSGNENCQ
jgi:hypothetical protein